MKRTFCLILLLLPIIQLTNAQVTENFNTRSGVALSQLKGYLQNHCWTFPDFDINRNGWNTGAEGNGAMISSNPAGFNQLAGIYTPVLDVPEHITVSFTYQFNQPVEQG